MLPQDNAHTQFGIDEVYFHVGFTQNLLEKLHNRAVLTLDGEDRVVLKYASHDMILIFYKRAPNNSLIYRFLEFLGQDVKQDFIKSNLLLNEEELYSAVKSKNFMLVTPRILIKEAYEPT